MTMERLTQPVESCQPAAAEQKPSHFETLRKRADQYAQAARDAIAKVKALGETQRQLESLRNESAQ